ncbi:MAG: hypothetical protein R3B72_39040 [Polyangiaceae bacterium]
MAEAFERERVFARGEARKIGKATVWNADLAWAALCSLEDAAERVRTLAAVDFQHPPRRLVNTAFHERYGDAILPLLDALVDDDGRVSEDAWFVGSLPEGRSTSGDRSP